MTGFGHPQRDAAVEGEQLLRSGRLTDARAVLLTAVAAGDRRPATSINLALAEEGCGEVEAARRRMTEVEAAVPGWDEPPLRLAESLRRAGDWTGAEWAYRRALRANPSRQEALVALGAGLVLRGRSPEAIPFLAQASASPGASFEAHHALGVALLAAGEPAAAVAALDAAHREAPGRFDIVLQRADAALAAGLGEAELTRLDGAAALAPLDPQPLRARAHVLREMGQLAEAADVLEAALALAPEDAACAASLGSVLANLDRPGEAEIALRRALALNPSDPQVRADLATMLIRRLGFVEAESLLRALIAELGPEGVLLSNLATALLGQGRQEDAVATARRATEVAPDTIQPWRTLSAVLPYQHSAEEHAAASRACARLFPRGRPAPFANARDADRPLRVGLLASALRSHPVGWLTVAGWEALDPARYDLVCLGPQAPGDTFARRFAARASAWHDAADDAAMAALCRALELDIIVDMGGHGEGGCLGALALRAAPVQVKWVGSQVGTTGLAEMDWFLTDRWETPPGSDDLYSERLLRLPDGYVCYDTPSGAPDVTPLPALAAGRVTFGCFNNLAKVTPETLTAWSAILARLPRACLILKAPQLDDRELRSRFTARIEAANIALDRVTLRGACNHRAHLGAYTEVDIALDPFPYSGGLSTCEALWMGVPTVTLPGRGFASRHTLSHQENAGLSGWSADTPEDYVSLAVRRASDLDALAGLRAGLRAQVAASPLCDAPRFGRSLDAALRHAWRSWCVEEGRG